MQLRLLIVLSSLLVAACEPQQPNDNQPEPCQPAGEGVPVTYTVNLVGFPEVEGNTLVDYGLDYEGSCVLDEMAYAGDQLTLSLACEHPAPSVAEGASVSITTAAAGLPAGVEIGDTLTFSASVLHFEHIGGDASGPIFRALESAGYESYSLFDADGPVFAAKVNGLDGSYGPIELSREYDCPNFDFCGDPSEGDIQGFVRATVGQAEVDVQVGEVGLLQSGDLEWDLSLFQARLKNDCHDGVSGGFSLVRRPA